MLPRLAPSIERAWYSSPGWLWLLYPLECVFFLIVTLRRYAFAKGWLRSHHPGVPVLVVGNLSAGGSGKTPVVIALVQAFQEAGYRVGVVSRGYGGAVRGVERLQESSVAARVGDEPLLIYQSTGAEVVVGADRVAAAEVAVASGAEIIVSDDGLQHYRLARDIEIVTMDKAVGLGNGHLMPVGPLREGAWRLQSVDHVLERNGPDAGSATHFEPSLLRRHMGTETRSVAEHGLGTDVHAVVGIARPERFFATLRGIGLNPREHVFPDHYGFSAADFVGLDDLPIVVTEKDAVKLPVLEPSPWIVEMKLQLPTGFAASLLTRINELIEERQ